MPLSNPGKQPVFQSRFETILYSCGCGAYTDGPNNFSNLHSGHLTVNLRFQPLEPCSPLASNSYKANGRTMLENGQFVWHAVNEIVRK